MTSTETPAERFYKNHLKNVSNYQKRNPEKMREKNKKFNDKLKEENGDKYQARLSKQKEYYQTVVKPKRDALKKTDEELSDQ